MYPTLTKNLMESRKKKTILSEFARSANIEGINNAGRAPSPVRVCIWLTIFVLLVALTINDVVQLVQDYLSYPVDVSTTLEHEDTVDFPSVTICNRNIVSCQNLQTFVKKYCEAKKVQCKNEAFIKELVNLGKCGEDGSENKEFSPGESNETNDEDGGDGDFFKKREKPSGSNFHLNKDTLQTKLGNQNQSQILKIGQDFLATYLQLSDFEKRKIGHSLTDLVKSCTFRGIDCINGLGGIGDTLMTYETSLSPKYGNCYTIFTENELLGRSSLTGADYGLSLVLNIQSDTYLRGGQSMAVGARVSVQDRNSLPLVEEFGLDMSPGALTSVSLQMVNITRHKYTGCVSNTWMGNEYEDQLKDEDKDLYGYVTYCKRKESLNFLKGGWGERNSKERIEGEKRREKERGREKETEGERSRKEDVGNMKILTKYPAI